MKSILRVQQEVRVLNIIHNRKLQWFYHHVYRMSD